MALKRSRQREMIKSFLMGRKDHPTADVIYSNLKQQDPNLSLGTVYRNLTLLSDMGEILRLRVGDGVDHFDADTSEHYHFVCTECGGVIDLDMESTRSQQSKDGLGEMLGGLERDRAQQKPRRDQQQIPALFHPGAPLTSPARSGS